MNEKMSFRLAERKDTDLIIDFIHGLAVYEKMEDQFETKHDVLEQQLFDEKRAEVVFVMEDGKEVGFALFFHNFSTFIGHKCLYLEDLFVYPEYRGKGYGKALLKKLAEIAVERNCRRLDWCCLDWNKPSIEFYKSLGAICMEDWLLFRATGDALKELAK